MLLESGDLIPVLPEAVDIPWTRRKAQIMNFLHRGAVNFRTLVYDSNVGDIAPLSTYFNPGKWTVMDLNQKFGQVADSVTDSKSETASNVSLPQGSDVKSASLTPKLILYPELAKLSRPLSFGDSRPRKLPGQSSRSQQQLPSITVWSVPPPALASPSFDSNLPTPPSKTPPHDDQGKASSGDENPDPIGPRKRRRMSALDDPMPRRLSVFNFGTKLTRPVSTSSPWTPLCSSDALSPFISFDSTWCQFDSIPGVSDNSPINNDFLQFDDENIDPFEDIKSDDSGALRDEQALVRSLRKIAKAFEAEEW